MGFATNPRTSREDSPIDILADIAQAMPTVLTDEAAHAARDSGFSRRASKLGGATFLQVLTFACLKRAEPTLEDFAQTAAACGAPVQPQAIDQRFTSEAADCLQRVLGRAIRQVVAQHPVAIPLLQRFHGVHLQDSTTVPLPAILKDRGPGCGGRNADRNQATIQFQVQFDLCRGPLSGPLPPPGRTADLPGSVGF
jgi:hypothetical protein